MPKTRITHHITGIVAVLLGLLTLAGPVVRSSTGPLLGFHIAKGDAVHLEAARAAGAGFVVIVFSWADIDPEQNHVYWEVPDAALRAAEFYGLDVVARLDRPPLWAVDDTTSSPWDLDAYAAFTQMVAARYGDRLAGIIVWNEPNLSLEWANQPPNPKDYVRMLQTAYPAIKAAAPDLPVLAAGLAFTNSNNDTALNDLEYLRALYAHGGGAYFDIMAAHAYGFGRPPADPPRADVLNFRRLELQREIMAANGDGDKPIWITEMGWRTGAPDSDDAWQVVSPQRQRDYTLQAIDFAAEHYPWLERLALWEINADGDDYGYYLWHGPPEVSRTYRALAATCQRFNPNCRTDPADGPAPLVRRQTTLSDDPPPNLLTTSRPVTILSPDVIIRLGDRGTLHPHWVHLHRGGKNFSPDWQGEFFLSHSQASRDYDLLLETMQVDQPSNRILINEVDLANLNARPRPDPTSTWTTQRFRVSAELLRPGLNKIKIMAGPRNSAWQYALWRWENFQFRHIRLAVPASLPDPLFAAWWQRPSPSGWAETNRLRPGLAKAEFWLTGNRPGQIWRGSISGQAGATTLHSQAANQTDRLFTDVLPLPEGTLAATDRGLLWRAKGTTFWSPIEGGPDTYSYVVAGHNNRYYAGFEAAGLWSASSPGGPWQPTSLPARLTVLDLGFGSERIYAATDDGVYVQSRPRGLWQRLPDPPGDDGSENGNPARRFVNRLYANPDGDLVVRSLDQLWRYPASAVDQGLLPAWQPFGPTALHQSHQLYGLEACCGPGSLISTANSGVWQSSGPDTWQRLDKDLTDKADITALLRSGDKLYGAGITALLQSTDEGQTWHKVEGLPSVISDLVVDPANPKRWIAATGAGLHRSEDSGQTWQPISPPWSVWDLALGPQGRLFAARAGGVVWVDNLGADTISWHLTAGLEEVLFFNVDPHPTNPDILLAGTWGNDLGVSYDGGQAIESIHNGLETLSVLDVLWHPTAGQLTIGTVEGLFRSDDSGQSWFKLPGPLMQQTIHALWQTADGTLWAGTAAGLWFSRDYGVAWQRVDDLPTSTVLRLGTVRFEGESWLWAGTEAHGLWLSADNGTTWAFGGLADTSVYNILVDPSHPDQLIAATSRGIRSTLGPDSKD